MRLSATQTQTILLCVRQQFGADASVMLFGSRLDDAPRHCGTTGSAFARMARGRALALEDPS